MSRVFNETFGPYELLRALSPNAQCYLGIGVQEGKCVRHVLEGNRRISLVLCDTWGPVHGGTDRGSHEHITEMLKEMDHSGSVKFLDGFSGDLIPTINFTLDLAFVDGGHDYPTALVDLQNTWPLVRQAMLVHDVWMPPVSDAVGDWLKTQFDKGPSRIEFYPSGTGTMVAWR